MLMRVTVLLCALCCCVALTHAEEKEISSRITAVSLFKNGYVQVTRSIELPGPGAYVLTDVPEPVHGTWSLKGGEHVETRVALRETKQSLTLGQDQISQEALAGRTVTLIMGYKDLPPVTGVVENVEKPRGEEAWNRTYNYPQNYGYYYYNNPASPNVNNQPNIVVKTANGRVVVRASSISYVQIEGGGNETTVRRPVMLLTAGPEFKGPATVTATYLTRGMAWAPYYQIDISDAKQLTIEQTAAIKNELADLKDADVQLISGFPNIAFAHVTSPLSMRTNLAQFMQQMQQEVRQGRQGATYNAVRQQAALDNEDAAINVGDLVRAAGDGGVDMHYQSIGKRTLAEGEAINVSVGSGKAEYRRIIEWMIPDTREANGRFIQQYERDQNPEKYRDAAWDAVTFKNPLPFPMTTAPATVVSGGRFNGQRMSYWTAPGAETTVHVTKAFSLRTRHVETEEGEGERKIVYIGGNDYRRPSVKGEMTLTNQRNEAIEVVVRRCFSGELVEAEGDPKKSLREEGVYSVNPRHELRWTLKLQPGETKTFTYRYTVLVDN